MNKNINIEYPDGLDIASDQMRNRILSTLKLTYETAYKVGFKDGQDELFKKAEIISKLKEEVGNE